MNIQLQAASIIGRSHQRMLYNNQDAYAYHLEKDYVVGVVCDGCGSYAGTEVGAQLMSQYIVNYFRQDDKLVNFSENQFQSDFQDYLKQLVSIQNLPSKSDEQDFIKNHLLATIIGFVTQEDQLIIFSAGDGIVQVNGQTEIINQNNRPSYFAKRLLDPHQTGFEFRYYPLAELQDLLIATDGLEDLHEYESDMYKGLEIRPLKRMPQMRGLYRNPVALYKYLAARQELLLDDTTLIMFRRNSVVL